MDGESRSNYWRIALTFVVTFAVSLAYLIHQQRSQQAKGPSMPATAASAPPRLPALPPVPAAPPFPPANLPPTHASVVTPVPPPMPAAASGPEEAPPPELVPVVVRMRRFPGGRIEGQIRNTSEKALTLTVSSRSRDGADSEDSTLTVGPLESKEFGTDEGMALRSGDRFLVQSQGYQERESAVP